MEEVEIPQYFLCPISLQIMKDPVTVVTGITYDRESITRWLLAAEEASCPVTKQPLARDAAAELTPNHMLRRLIQAWCIANSDKGIDRLPSPKSPLTNSRLHRLIRDLNNPQTFMKSLNQMEELAAEEKNRKCMEESDVVNSMILFIVKSFKESEIPGGLEQALRIFCLVWTPSEENKSIVNQNHRDLIPPILRIMNTKTEIILDQLKTQAMAAMKIITEVSSSSSLEGLNQEIFSETMVSLIRRFRTKPITQQTTKDALHVLIHACQWGRNRLKIIEAGAIFELIELELSSPGKRISELVFCLLANLCSLAEGRQLFLKHAGAIAVVSKRTLTVSPATDDWAVQILAAISKCSATKEVVLEMLRVGAVSKLCMVLQADCEVRLKKKAREILRSHSSVWSDSPCIQEKYYGTIEGLKRPFSNTNVFVYVHRR
ncbi:PREDICTED: E3 ubiquitin-protein ligase PUB23-like [Ipomoea nil]|uniref:E3 ubiquitin-protein ligase PUB23-like n=1 Tax=Ipomoea nil TaxID=35883 RepID=UPI000901EC2D|nr:PREDICTED: E3 ubiquitin-protein ligase PUB23-like [Ipomoea nil]